MKIAEVPTTLSPDGRSRPPHLRPFRDGWRHLRFMFLFSPRWLFVVPGTLLFVLSALAYGALLMGPVKIGQVEFDVHTLFYAEAGLILGYLALILGGLIRMFGMREGLLQEHETLEKLRASPVLEVGGLIGLSLIGAGIVWGVQNLAIWNQAHYYERSAYLQR